MALILVAFGLPVALLLARSFTQAPGGLTYYKEFLSSAALVQILIRTVVTAALVTLVSLLIGYPFAYLAISSRPTPRRVLMGIVSASLLVGLVVRGYAWLAILDRGGLVNATLRALHLEDLQFVGVHNLLGVVIGVLQYTLPFVILPIYDGMSRVDAQLPRAAASLGAGPVRAFAKVYFPLTLPGVVAGCTISFIAVLGYYILPSILGGPQNMMVGQLIAGKMLTSVGQGTAIASILLLVSLALFVVFYRVTTRVAR
jgi:ABC-type spermidine/putrescine transport system permease subunit I